MGDVRIEGMEDIERWLHSRTQVDAIAIASRAALRTLPNIELIFESDIGNPRDSIILPVFRAIHASATTRWRIAIAEANRAVLSATYSAALSAATRSAARDAVFTATRAAAFSAAAAAHDGDSAFSAAAAADDSVLSVSYPNSGIWALIQNDVRFLADADNAATLAARPLWPDGDPPDWAAENWARLKAHLRAAEGEDWDVWIDWYEGQLAGFETTPPNLPLEEAILLIPDEIWEAGPKATNAEIRRLMDLHKPKPKRRTYLTIEEAIALAEQDGRGFRVVSENGVFILDKAAEAEQEQVEADLPMIRNRAARLLRAFEQANYPMQQDCADDARLFCEIVAGDYDAIAGQARNLWNISIGFGSAFERDTEERKRQGELLTADQRAAIDVFLATSANFVRLFPAVREMDSENRLHRNIENRHALTVALIESTVQHDILLKADADILLALAQIANAATAQSAKAANALDVTKTNLLKRVALLGAAGAGAVASGALAQVGVDLESQLQLSERSIEFIRVAENDIRAFIASLPSDIRAPMSHAIDAILAREDE